MRFSELVVVVPHSGLVIPSEIPPESLSDDIKKLSRNIDWYTNWLYDFRDILDNRHIVFPYCSLILEANRHPDRIDESVPLKDVFGEDIYRSGKEPSPELRKALSEKYLKSFHRSIEESILSGAEFLFEGHSTMPARGVSENQIDLMNFQHSRYDTGPVAFSPDIFIETYSAELRKRLPEVNVTVNESEYYKVYGHICSEHSSNSLKRNGKRIPSIIQETSHGLYLDQDGRPNIDTINRLRRAFAESIFTALNHVQSLHKSSHMIDIHSLRQTYDFDCGTKALQTLMSHYGVMIREDALLKELGTDALGTSIEKMISVAESYGFTVKACQNWTLEDLKKYIDQGHPIIVSLQAWADDYLTVSEWKSNYDDGHYAIVIGYNDKVIFFEDPSSFHRTWLNHNEFFARWHDKDMETGEKLEQFAMVLLGRDPVEKTMEHME
ncbi:MAG: cysteine peptidase family C39 domain-containing protein [Thermoplasmatota archaeon]